MQGKQVVDDKTLMAESNSNLSRYVSAFLKFCEKIVKDWKKQDHENIRHG